MAVLLTTATVVVTAGIVVVSLFGMNIHTELTKDPETDEEARIRNLNFWETTFGTVFGCLAMYLVAICAGNRSQIFLRFRFSCHQIVLKRNGVSTALMSLMSDGRPSQFREHWRKRKCHNANSAARVFCFGRTGTPCIRRNN